jgi:hypothetical protein
VLSDRSARRFAQDDDSVVGIKNIGSSSKNAKGSKKSQALRMTIPWWGSKHRVVFKKRERIEKVTSSQDDDSVVGIKNIGSSSKNTKGSKKSQALRMTIPWWGSKTLGRLQKTRKDRKSHKLSGKALHSASLRFHGRPGQAG